MTSQDFEVVDLDDANSALVLIDQTKLPNVTEFLHLTSQESIWEAIYKLQVRGAPAIGVAAGFGSYLAAKEIAQTETTFDGFYEKWKAAKAYLNSSRPTAVNLSWALQRMEDTLLANKSLSIPELVHCLKEESLAIKNEDAQTNRAIGEYGLSLLQPGMGILTHCNAGWLATTRYGTATAPIYLGHEKGYQFRVYCDETRPLLQGARLTAWELQRAGIDTTLLCDNMAPTVMRNGWIDAIFVGCDRVAANGDVANKIGTSYVALAAKHYDIPFYVCAPTSTIDLETPTGKEIPIEQRKPEEVTTTWYKEPMAPADVKVFNPAFDVTDAALVSAIITEKGIIEKPTKEKMADLLKN